MQWKLINFTEQDEIIRLYGKIDGIDKFPAANQWQFLFPVLEEYFDTDKTCFAVLYSNNHPIFIMPISLFTMSKFIFTWQEIGFPFHKHINLIKIPSVVLDNNQIIDDLIKVVRMKFGNKWARFSIRNIESENQDFEYGGDISLFKTFDHLSINQIVSKKHIRNIRRLEKKLVEENQSIALNTNTPTLNTSLSDFIEVEKSSWKGSQGVAIYSSNKLLKIYRKLCSNFSERKMFIAKLEMEKEIIATVLGFHLGSTLYIHKISHNQDYSKFAPGNILILKLLGKALEDNSIEELNLVTSPEWAKRWHPNTRNIVNLIHFNRNLSGKLLRISILNWRLYKPYLKLAFRRG